MEVAVIGAGASGLMAAYAASQAGADVSVFEKNEKCGKKIYITGKGRCNLTNAVPPQEFLQNVVTNAKFLTGAINRFSPDDMYSLLTENGLKLKIERGNRVFPQSDKASDVTKCLEGLCRNSGVKFYFNKKVTDIAILDSTVSGIIIDGKQISFDRVIVCTGGISYPFTGSTGDGLCFAKKAGHNIVQPRPALCGINLRGDFFKELQGLTLKNVRLDVSYCGKPYKSFFGEALFTHFGVSGPIVLSASSYVTRLDLKSVGLSLDFKPALDFSILDERLVREFSATPNKSLQTVFKTLLPSALISEVLKRCGLSSDKKANCVTRAERDKLCHTLKCFKLDLLSLRPIEEAIVTSGGVDVSQVNPKTMESKLVKGLFMCGEVLDLDALTGGFNLQIAFSTGFVAGSSV